MCGSEDPDPYHNVTYGTVFDTLIKRSYRYRAATDVFGSRRRNIEIITNAVARKTSIENSDPALIF